jgi:hypothetical protein
MTRWSVTFSPSWAASSAASRARPQAVQAVASGRFAAAQFGQMIGLGMAFTG